MYHIKLLAVLINPDQHRWALNQISVGKDIRLNLISEPRTRAEESAHVVRHYVGCQIKPLQVNDI